MYYGKDFPISCERVHSFCILAPPESLMQSAASSSLGMIHYLRYLPWMHKAKRSSGYCEILGKNCNRCSVYRSWSNDYSIAGEWFIPMSKSRASCSTNRSYSLKEFLSRSAMIRSLAVRFPWLSVSLSPVPSAEKDFFAFFLKFSNLLIYGIYKVFKIVRAVWYWIKSKVQL